MIENRFDYCKNAPAVMDEYAVKYYGATDIEAMRSEALARIRELTPRTVNEGAYKRAAEFLDRIIDALGITADPEPAPVADDALTITKHHAPVADAPVVKAVDMDVNTLRTFASFANGFDQHHIADDVKVTVNGIRSTLYRDEDGQVRVVIGGAL